MGILPANYLTYLAPLNIMSEPLHQMMQVLLMVMKVFTTLSSNNHSGTQIIADHTVVDKFNDIPQAI